MPLSTIFHLYQNKLILLPGVSVVSTLNKILFSSCTTHDCCGCDVGVCIQCMNVSMVWLKIKATHSKANTITQ